MEQAVQSQKFLRAVTALYGENWPAPFSAATGIALRTCQRVKKALDAGEADIRLAGMMAGLAEALSPALDLLDENNPAGGLETAYWQLLAAANKALGDPTDKAARDRFLEVASSRVVESGGAVAVEESGMLSVVKPPRSLFGVDLSMIVGRGGPVVVVPVETAMDLPAMQKCAKEICPGAEIYSSWAVVGLPCEGAAPAVIVRPSGTIGSTIGESANRLAEGYQALWPSRDVVVFFYDQTGQLRHMGKPTLAV